MQRTFDIVPLALVLVLAVGNGSELFSGDLLESLRSADIAGIGIDQQERLDLRDTSDNATDSDELPEMHTLHFANSHRGVGKQGLEV